MKTSNLLGSAACLVAFCGTLSAQSVGSAAVASPLLGNLGNSVLGSNKGILPEFDRDGDGKLNSEERKALQESRKQQMMARFDANKDGILSESELSAAQASNAGQTRRRVVLPDTEQIAKYDQDGDGGLNEVEQKHMQAQRTQEHLAKYDANKDGKLSADERAAMIAESKVAREKGIAASNGSSKPASISIAEAPTAIISTKPNGENLGWGEKIEALAKMGVSQGQGNPIESDSKSLTKSKISDDQQR